MAVVGFALNMFNVKEKLRHTGGVAFLGGGWILQYVLCEWGTKR